MTCAALEAIWLQVDAARGSPATILLGLRQISIPCDRPSEGAVVNHSKQKEAMNRLGNECLGFRDLIECKEDFNVATSGPWISHCAQCSFKL